MSSRSWFVVALLSVLGMASDVRAQATTCDRAQKQCCAAWIANVVADGKNVGLLREDTYAEIARAIDKHEKWNKRFCRFFGPQSQSCRERVEGPMCRPVSATQGLANGIESQFDDILRNAVGELENRGRDVVELPRKDYGRLGRGIAPWVPPQLEDKNPFFMAGDTLVEYKRALTQALEELKRLREIFRSITLPKLEEVTNDIEKLWQDNGGFADSAAVHHRKFDFGQQIADVLDRIGPPPVAPPPHLDIDRDYKVVKMTSAPPAMVIAVGEHAMTRAFKLPRGNYPLGAVRITKDGVFAQTVNAVKTKDRIIFYVQGGGSVELAMIPDIDGDGVLDAKDRCKEMPGPAALHGCPDGDGDKVVDTQDRCPTLVGEAPTGCPTPKPCNSQQHAGSDAPEVHVISVGKGSGTVDLRWNMKDIPDRILVYYEGKLLEDTGCTHKTGIATLTFTGHSGLMEVRVEPNCEFSSTGTSWDFSLGCAR